MNGRRAGPFLVAVGVMALLAMVVTGGGPGLPLIILIPSLAAGVWLLAGGRRATVEVRWAGGVTAADDSPAAVIAVPPSAPPEASPRPPATPRQVRRAISRVECRLWLSNPWFAVGVAFWVMITVLFGWVWAGPEGGVEGGWRDWFVLLPVMAHPLVGMTVVGAHHAVTRGRREGAEEIFGACPTSETTRTAGHLAAGWVPALTSLAFVVTMTGLLAVRTPRIYGSLNGADLAAVFAAVVLGACGSALGVALGRWAPWRLVPIVVVVALVPIITGLGNIGEPHWSNARQLSSWPRYPNHDLLFTDPPVWWHLAWLTGLGLLMAWLALVHADRSRRMVGAGVALALAVTAVGTAMTRPLSGGDAERLASLVAEPEAHQVCRGTARVRVCGYPRDREHIDQILAEVEPVVAALPEDTLLVSLRTVFDGELDMLGPEVGAALDGRAVPTDGFLPVSFHTRGETMAVARFRVALDATGLPTTAPDDAPPQVIAGEARGVVALWLAARGLDPQDAVDLASHHYEQDDHENPDPPTALDLGMAWPDVCSGGANPPVAWSAQDLAAARALLAQPDGAVGPRLREDWDQLTAPDTTTDELLTTFGLAPVGPPDRIDPKPLRCEY